MNNWIKPSELPKDFWSECFVHWSNDSKSSLPIYMVRNFNHYDEEVLEIYSEVQRLWEPMIDAEYKLMIIEKPEYQE